jgi:hypothetical protein
MGIDIALCNLYFLSSPIVLRRPFLVISHILENMRVLSVWVLRILISEKQRYHIIADGQVIIANSEDNYREH